MKQIMLTIRGPVDVLNIIQEYIIPKYIAISTRFNDTLFHPTRNSKLKDISVESMFDFHEDWKNEIKIGELHQYISEILHDNYTWIFDTKDYEQTEFSIPSSETVEEVIDFILNNSEKITEESRKYMQHEVDEIISDITKDIEFTKRNKERMDEFYGDLYNPPKNAKSVTYNGKTYKSKAQCCYIENITSSKLNKYLKNNE